MEFSECIGKIGAILSLTGQDNICRPNIVDKFEFTAHLWIFLQLKKEKKIERLDQTRPDSTK